MDRFFRIVTPASAESIELAKKCYLLHQSGIGTRGVLKIDRVGWLSVVGTGMLT